MIAHQLTLIRRELWEHPAIYVTPLAIAVVISLLTLTGQVTVSAFGEAVDLAIVGAQNVGEGHRANVLTGVLTVVTSVFAVGAWIIMVFYCLDALYAERKDKSILFWRSMPITDAESVISKLLTALLAIPLITLLIVVFTHLVILALGSVWVMIKGGDAGHLIWGPVQLADVWLACLMLALVLPLWLSPFLGWFLFVSAFSKRAPFLTAFLPILILPMLEKLLTGTHFFYDALFTRSVRPPIVEFEQFEWMENESADMPMPLGDEVFSLSSQIDLGHFLASPSLWAGLLVCGLFTVAAIYVRRYRDESY